MSQTYTEFIADNRLGTSQQAFDDRTDTLRSQFSGTSAPSNPVAGQPFYNTDDETLEIWNGAAWVLTSAKNNVAETTDPGVGDDDADGYSAGSFWINATLGKAFICVDASTGAAVWLRFPSALNKWDATTAPTANDDSGDGYEPGSTWVDVTNKKSYTCVDATAAAAVWKETSAGGAFAEACCVVTMTVSQAIDASVLTVLNFDSEITDTDSMHDDVTANNRITFTTAGHYIFGVSLDWETGSGSSIRQHFIKDNAGTTLAESDRNDTRMAEVGSARFFSAADWIEIEVFHASTTDPLDIELLSEFSPIFWAMRVGD